MPAGLIDQNELTARYRQFPALPLRLLEVTLSTHADTVGAIRAAMATGNSVALFQLAHKLKGSAANLCAPALIEPAREVEMLARADEPGCWPLAGHLAQLCADFLAEIGEILACLRSTASEPQYVDAGDLQRGN